MNKKKFSLILFAFLLFPTFLFSQETETEEKTEIKKEWEKHQIKFTLTKIFNPVYPGIELGYEYHYSRFSSQISVAYICIPYFSNSLSGYHFKFDEKFFFKKQPPRNTVRFYLSVEVGYNYIKQNKNHTFLPVEYKYLKKSDKEQYAYSINSDAQKQAIITNCKFGTQIKVKKIILEPSVGIGLGFHYIIHYNKLHDDDILFNNGVEPTFSFIVNKEGFRVLPSFAISFKIGYTF